LNKIKSCEHNKNLNNSVINKLNKLRECVHTLNQHFEDNKIQRQNLKRNIESLGFLIIFLYFK